MRKPRVFIASSTESLFISDAINVNMDHQAEVTVWKNGFQLSSNSIDSLVKMANTVDFAIFIFTPDDVTTIRDQSKNTVRDNVLFELGLFTGALGKERCFIVKPRDIDLHFPTDLLGLTPADFDGKRSDGDIVSAVNHPCVLIKKEIANLGLVSQDLDIQKKRRKNFGYIYKMNHEDHILLSKILEGYADSPDGSPVWSTFNDLNHIDRGTLTISSIKLERMGYLDKSIISDQNGNEMFTFYITANGIDYLLENESLIENSKKKIPSSQIQKSIDDGSFPF